MGSQHIAIFTHMAAGHVYPVLGLCSELVSRGYRVTYPANERFSTNIRKTGATAPKFTPLEERNSELTIDDSSPEYSSYWHAFTHVFAPMWLASAAAAVVELEGFYASNPPDLILYDEYFFAGRILARRYGCLAAQLRSHFAHRDSLMRIDGVCTTPEPMLAFSTAVDSFMSTYGFEQTGHLSHFEQLNMTFVPKEFQYDSDSFDGRFRFVGATHNRLPRMGMWKNRTEKGKLLLLISENTASDDDVFLRVCIEAFADSQYHVVFSKGLNSPEALSTPLPSNFEINRTAFNCEILPFANVMLCQAGMGTTLESLYHGVPVVAVPSSPFNAEVAYRVAELGMGAHVPARGMTPKALRETVDLVSSDAALLRRVKQMKTHLEKSPGAKTAADWIEEYLVSPD